MEKEKSFLESENLELRHLAEIEDNDDYDDDLPDSGFRSQQIRFQILAIYITPSELFFSSANSSEMIESEDDLLDAELRKSICSSIYATLCQGESTKNTPDTQRKNRRGRINVRDGFNFSPVESLDSSFSLGKESSNLKFMILFFNFLNWHLI